MCVSLKRELRNQKIEKNFKDNLKKRKIFQYKVNKLQSKKQKKK